MGYKPPPLPIIPPPPSYGMRGARDAASGQNRGKGNGLAATYKGFIRHLDGLLPPVPARRPNPALRNPQVR